MSPKDLLKEFYNTDVVKSKDLVEQYYHKDIELHWNSSEGFRISKFDDILRFFKNVRENYLSIRYEISHLLEDSDNITSRYTVYGKTIENEDEEIPLAHYMCIWQIKDNKLYRGYQISQLADDNAIESNSFSEIKV
ncbi:nuclear transport factor 2 family protein [Xanthomarina sp. F1114]|uniref:nuclear transport factor 2 family protein n=1 Tax=Xanthomarina sp. F1114 TaxID=2996019 RepID=UPI00225E63C2|nr:nuclear transport factor 2 family protein [Xanthomarina sp. F1114]MCX7548408.1 nuclear transport factor 2 family protein [Xanthomarina sp. F1114]